MKTYVLIILATALASCSTLNQKRNDRAVLRVLTDSTLFEHVGREWEQLNPCANDTAFGGDSVEVEVDIPAYQIYFDSSDNYVLRTDSSFIRWDIPGPNPTSAWIKAQGSAKARVKAPVAYVTDNRRLALARDTIAALADQLFFLINAYEVRDSICDEEKKDAARLRVELEVRHQKEMAEAKGSYWLRLASPLLALVAGYFGYRQFRKKSSPKKTI